MISEIRLTLEGVDSNNETVLCYGLDEFLTKDQYKKILIKACRQFEKDATFFGSAAKAIKDKVNDAA
jgi:spore maturation protein CgeB